METTKLPNYIKDKLIMIYCFNKKLHISENKWTTITQISVCESNQDNVGQSIK